MQLPLYQKISNQLKADIIKQKFKVGEQLPTEKELSETYQVSRITAKRALTELEQLGLVTRTRGKGTFVKQASSKLSQPQTSPRVLFIIPFEGMSFGDFTQGLVPVLEAQGIMVFITYTNYFKDHSAELIQQSFEALIYYPMDTSDYLDVLLELSLQNFPVILLDKKIYDLPFPCVTSDNLTGGKLATEFLVAQGHQRIAFVMSNESHHPHTTRNRYMGYITVLRQQNLAFHTTLEAYPPSDQAILELIDSQKITGLVCENDLIALQTMTNLQTKAYQIPQDISIVGFDNIQAAALSNPSLTTVAQDFSKMGAVAGELLLQWLKTGKTPADTKIPVQLIQRNSTQNFS